MDSEDEGKMKSNGYKIEQKKERIRNQGRIKQVGGPDQERGHPTKKAKQINEYRSLINILRTKRIKNPKERKTSYGRT